FPHGSNAQGFLNPRPGEAAVPEYHFVVITPGGSLSPPAEVVATQFGEPARKVQAGPDEVWVYDRLENSLLARYLCALEAPRLRFYRGDEPVGSVNVPPVPWTAGLPHWSGGLQARLVAVPPEARERPWDRVVIRPAGPAPVCHVGHLLAYEQDVPCLPAASFA